MERQLEKSLHKAIRDKNLQEVVSLLTKVKDVNFHHRNSEPILCSAAEAGHLGIVEAILDKGALLNKSGNQTGYKPIHFAAKNGHLDVVKELVRCGDDIQSQTDMGDSVLYISVVNKQPQVVKYLIDSGANVNETASFLYTRNYPIHGAAGLHDVTILNLILASKANIDCQNDEQKTALHIAAVQGCNQNVERLIKCGAKVNMKDSSGRTPLQLACDSDHVEVVRLLCVAGADMNVYDGQGSDPLECAVTKRHINVVRTLLHFGADVNKTYSSGKTALHKSIGNCKHKMREKWGSGPNVDVNKEIEMLDTLLQSGADINVIDDNGCSPLHICVTEGCAAVLDYLIESGANYNQVNNKGMTPLQLACQNNITPAIQVLIQHCPGLVNHLNHVELDTTPLIMMWDKRNLECLKLLCDAGYQPTTAERTHVEFIPRQNHKKVDGQITNLLTNEFSNPWTLTRICRTLIRNKLHKDLATKVACLPVPERIRDSLLLLNTHWL